MFKVEFIYNGYKAEVTSDTPSALEMDIVECRTVLHRLPPGIPPRPIVVDDATSKPAVAGDVTHMGSGGSSQEIVPITSIEKTKTKTGGMAFKCRGGKYETFGVMMYPDTCLFKDNIEPTMIMNDVVSGLEMLVAKVGGSLRVKAVRRKQVSV